MKLREQNTKEYDTGSYDNAVNRVCHNYFCCLQTDITSDGK